MIDLLNDLEQKVQTLLTEEHQLFFIFSRAANESKLLGSLEGAANLILKRFKFTYDVNFLNIIGKIEKDKKETETKYRSLVITYKSEWGIVIYDSLDEGETKDFVFVIKSIKSFQNLREYLLTHLEGLD